MGKHRNPYRNLDWTLIGCYLALVFFGWINIFSVLHGDSGNIFDFSQKYGMHLIWICISLLTGVVIIRLLPANLWPSVAWVAYGAVILLLLATLVLGVSSHGSQSWISIGSFRLQPAEFSKITTALALSTVMSKYGFTLKSVPSIFKIAGLLLLPMALILLEKETGSVLVYVGFLIVLYREGMSGWLITIAFLVVLEFILTIITSPYVAMVVAICIFLLIFFFKKENYLFGLIVVTLTAVALAFLPKLFQIEAIAAINPLPVEAWLAIITSAIAVFFILQLIILSPRKKFERNSLIVLLCGILFILSVQFFYNNILQDHQRNRIDVFLGRVDDPKGIGYNLHQSMVAIGSGGFAGKGFMNGTQTSLGYVPEQETDFIFCTIGEEWGLLGALFVLALYLTIISRTIILADKAKDSFTRIYGYCVAMCISVHVVINIGMTIGLMPVIGIPLPFLSYGGSALLAFTIMLAIFIKLIFNEQRA
ncbi:MAG: rod shape-determining protein RodA [Bacteroidales bacterium]|nr:rod shape-determining protein RodA [Bacteroidales bacterium]